MAETANTITVRTADDALLHVKTVGDGPPLLLIQGGISDADATRQLAGVLAERFTVISYDRRGLSRSAATPPTGAPADGLGRHARDAAAILAAVTRHPAHVVGASIGATIALRLALHAPEQVATVVAHEPPLPRLVLDPDREVGLDRVAALAVDDVLAAISAMGDLVADRSTPEADARPGRPAGDLRRNLAWFFAHDFPAVRSNAFDAAQATAIPSTTVVPSAGRDAPGGWEYRCAQVLATALGRDLLELPGGHNSLTTHPHGAAKQLIALLDP